MEIIVSCVEPPSRVSHKGSDFYRQYKKAADSFPLPQSLRVQGLRVARLTSISQFTMRLLIS